MKLYRELSKAIALLIIYLQDIELNIKPSIQNKDATTLNQISKEIESYSSKIDYLMIESYMLIAESTFSVMQKLSDEMSEIRPLHVNFITVDKYKEVIIKIKVQGEYLISEFRNDLQIEKISKNLINF